MQVSIAEFPLGKQPQPMLLAGAAPVQVGPVQVGGDLVHLLTQDHRDDDLDLDIYDLISWSKCTILSRSGRGADEINATHIELPIKPITFCHLGEA